MDRLVRARHRLAALDAWLLRQALKSRTPTNDRVLRTASQLANRSRLWVAVAAVLGSAGGSRGRRAAIRGLLGIGISSAVVNGPLKYVWRRQRPAAELLGVRPSLIAMPRSFSFPSGHSASAFAFATGVAREWPAVGAPVGAAAALVAYSRVHTGVHFPGDVLAGTGIGIASGMLAARLIRDDPGIQLPPAQDTPIPKRAVLLSSPGSGSADQLKEAKAALKESGIDIVDELPVEDKARLAEVVALPSNERPLVIAAGGDGTVGAAADELAGTRALLAILPLGTSNDVARSLGISPDPVQAAKDVVDGVVRAIDAGQVRMPGQPARNFVHAATVGFNVHFAELATKSSLRRRFGRFTYAVAGVQAMRQHEPFDCELTYDGKTEKLRLVQLSIINAPVFGGALDLRLPIARMDDRSLVVIAIEEGSAARMILGTLVTAIGRRREGPGVRAMRTNELQVHVEHPVDVALDGEISSNLPADFGVAAEALHIITPRLPHDRVR
ncbi:MAG TPA: YegS/Rv2252/BmrU family lipid kinase [Jatrophihabitantaceae bacterium]|jgi:undecaprenyl-diphosphatase|nr:YegS/Rv2252/BmrU family lipid kinase [Jatrophihabitantaceae bacterium]